MVKTADRGGTVGDADRRSGWTYRGRRLWITLLLVAVGLLIVAELALRLMGVVSIPLYRVQSTIGYYVLPNQQGAFLNRNRWAFDDEGLGVAEPFRSTPDGVLLLGDSVVYGGNSLDQPDKVGPLLAAALKRPVWPLSAGGWALINEIEALKAHPRLLGLPTMVVVSNTGDFGAAAPWSNETTYPTHRPWSALYYAYRKRISPPRDVVEAPTSDAATRLWHQEVAWLLGHYRGRLVWALYPQLAEVGKATPEFEPLVQQLDGRAEIVWIGRSPAWNRSLYRDRVIHPSVQGDRVLAEILANRIASKSPDLSAAR